MSFEKFSNNKNGDYSHEHERPQELIDLEWNISNRYFELAGVPREQIAEWMKAHGTAVRMIVDSDTEFAKEFVSVEEPNKEKFEELLRKYL